MSHLKESIPRIIVESVLIVFSILLALLVNQWREERTASEKTRHSLVSIRSEIQKNLQAIEKVLDYHLETVERLDNFLKENKKGLPRETTIFSLLVRFAPRGLNPPTLQSAAWETAVSTNSLNMDYDIVYRLSFIYKAQKVGIERTIPKIVDTIISRDSFDTTLKPLPSLHLMKLLMNELVGQERALINLYEEALTMLDEERKDG